MGCSSDVPKAASAPTSAAPAYDTFEKIGDGIGCLSLGNSEPETTDIAANKYCTLEHPTEESGGVTVYQYSDVAHRDKSLKAGLVYEQSYLVLSDTWAIAGDVRDLRKIRATLGTGDLRAPAADPSPSAGDEGVGPGDEGEDATVDGAKKVPLGKSATYHGERVQVGKVYCNAVDSSSKNATDEFDSCRLSELADDSDEYHAPKGQIYYLVAFRWKNISKAPVEPSDFGTLVTTDGTEYAADSDLTDSLTQAARGNDDFSTSSDMNPGTTGRILQVYSIPKTTKVASVHWGLDDYSPDDPAFALAVR